MICTALETFPFQGPKYGNNALVLHADCRSTNSGLFSGLIFLVSTLIVLIIYFILDSSDGCDDIEMSSMINKTYESIMTSVLIVATVWVEKEFQFKS